MKKSNAVCHFKGQTALDLFVVVCNVKMLMTESHTNVYTYVCTLILLQTNTMTAEVLPRVCPEGDDQSFKFETPDLDE